MDRFQAFVEALADRYAVQRELGRGGMATVYLAEDRRHHRSVAVKVLDPELMPIHGADRFLREIEIAAGLTYPHILPLLDSGAAAGSLYYVMPYIEGRSLRDRLDTEKQLSLEEATRIGLQVAGALDYAHSRGVVHRDIKPANILLSGGQALVSDFGIARGLLKASPRLTSTGSTVGTPTYMSPEQALGGEVDARADLYALGCVIYEMLAGQPPFTGTTAQMIQARHQFDPVPPLRTIRPALPEAIDSVLARAMAKAPADRFASARDLAQALERAASTSMAAASSAEPRRVTDTAADTVALSPSVSTVPAARASPPRWRAAAWLLVMAAVAVTVILFALRPREGSGTVRAKNWIIVADFEGPSADRELSTAARDLLSAALDQSGIVVTVPQDRIRQALRKSGRPDSTRVDPELASELAYRAGIRSVVAGRIQRLGEGYSLVVRVMDAESSAVVVTLSESARNAKDLIPTLSRLGQKLRQALGESRDALRATRPLTDVTTPSFQAFRHFIRAGDLVNSGRSAEAVAQARAAITLDPQFSAAWRAIAVAQANSGQPESAYAAFQKALEHPDRLEEWRELDVEAQMATMEGDYGRAISAYARALRLMPTQAALKNNMALRLSALGRFDEAVDTLRSALNDDPMGPAQVVLANYTEALLRLDRIEEAMVPQARMEPLVKRVYRMATAIVMQRWGEADSLGQMLVADPSASFNASLQATLLLSAERIQAGHVEEALEPGAMMFPTMAETISMVTEVPLPETPTEADGDGPPAQIVRAYRAIVRGHMEEARRVMTGVRARSGPQFLGVWPEYMDALIEGREGHWDETIRRMRPWAQRTSEPIPGWRMPPVGPVTARWAVAEAFEHLGRADSAAFYYHLALSTDRTFHMDRVRIRACAPYIHQRLALIYLRQGRLDEAERHGDVFIAAMTHADPLLRSRAEELRRHLASARAMSPRKS